MLWIHTWKVAVRSFLKPKYSDSWKHRVCGLRKEFRVIRTCYFRQRIRECREKNVVNFHTVYSTFAYSHLSFPAIIAFFVYELLIPNESGGIHRGDSSGGIHPGGFIRGDSSGEFIRGDSSGGFIRGDSSGGIHWEWAFHTQKKKEKNLSAFAILGIQSTQIHIYPRFKIPGFIFTRDLKYPDSYLPGVQSTRIHIYPGFKVPRIVFTLDSWSIQTFLPFSLLWCKRQPRVRKVLQITHKSVRVLV